MDDKTEEAKSKRKAHEEGTCDALDVQEEIVFRLSTSAARFTLITRPTNEGSTGRSTYALEGDAGAV